jgi:hypothetical protein
MRKGRNTKASGKRKGGERRTDIDKRRNGKRGKATKSMNNTRYRENERKNEKT